MAEAFRAALAKSPATWLLSEVLFGIRPAVAIWPSNLSERAILRKPLARSWFLLAWATARFEPPRKTLDGLSAVLPGASPCGRSNTRIRGWMGRADQSTKVRAMFVTAKQVDEIVRRHPEVLKARLVVEGETGSDRMTLRCETKARPKTLVESLTTSIRDVTKLRGEVELVDAGSLPNDGKVIEDLRKYV